MSKAFGIGFSSAIVLALALAGCLPRLGSRPGPSPFPDTPTPVRSAASSPAAARKLLLIEFFGIA
jgi:hypothetical protein